MRVNACHASHKHATNFDAHLTWSILLVVTFEEDVLLQTTHRRQLASRSPLGPSCCSPARQSYSSNIVWYSSYMKPPCCQRCYLAMPAMPFIFPTHLMQVSQEEADQVHQLLEEFRDEVNEEKVLRRLSTKRAASEGWVFCRSVRCFHHVSSIETWWTVEILRTHCDWCTGPSGDKTILLKCDTKILKYIKIL